MANSPPSPKRSLLSQTIAQDLGVTEHVHLYLRCLKKYPYSLTFRAYAEAKAMPQAHIIRSRPAIFFFLIKKYAYERKQNTSN